MDEQLYEQAKNIAISYITYAPRTKAQVCTRLKEKEFPCEIINAVVKTLLKYGFINDEKFVRDYINKCGRKMYGREKLAYDLKQKGIDINDHNLSEFDENEAALRLLIKKTQKSSEIEAGDRKRLSLMLKGRGFSYAAITDAFKKLDEGLR